MDLFVLSASLGLDITNFTGGINTARSLLLKFADAVVNFGKDVIQTGMGFDKQMSAVQAVMGLTENTEENLKTMNRLREFALEQARSSIFTAEETATAYYYMGMAGWRAEQMVEGLPGVMALAAASGEDLKLTSDMVTDSLTAFGLGAGQTSHFVDVLAVTATNSNTDVARMQQTFKNLAPIAGALGYSIDDVAVSVGILANAGIKGSLAGTALRNIFTRIATDAGATSKSMGALGVVTDVLGVSFYTAEGRARPWGEVLADVRKAWNELDPDKADLVAAAMGRVIADGMDASEVMSEFAVNLDEWTSEWNGLSSQVDRENFAAKLEPIFSALGISMRDSNGNLREFGEVAKEARVVLGGLTDEEQIYYGKQIGSLRGISGWLALMTASEEDVNQLTEAVLNADGAAQDMADTRLDNLWGDVKLLGAAFDVLKIAIYDDVKGPLREIVQWSTGALTRITDAINENGLAGGIEQLGIEIEAAGKKFEPMLESIGKAAAPVIDGLITTLLPKIEEAGIKLGTGLLKGIGDELANSDNPVSAALGMALGTAGYGVGWLNDWLSELGLYGTAGASPESKSAIDTYSPETRSYDDEVLFTYMGDPTMIPSWDIGINDVDATGVEDAIAQAGAAGGEKAAAEVEGAINSGSYTIDIMANVLGLPGSASTQHNARAMNVGRIFNRPTVFGYADSSYQIAGDAGPEAVIGVRSLGSMIRMYTNEAVSANIQSINAANNTVFQSMETMFKQLMSTTAREMGNTVAEVMSKSVDKVSSRPIVMDSGALVGAIRSDVDKTLGQSVRRRRNGHR